MYISLMQMVGLAHVKKTPPKAAYGDIRPVADEKTLEALIANRYEIMAGYAKQMQLAVKSELSSMKAGSADSAMIKAVKQWAHRDADKVPAAVLPELAMARVASPVLDKLVTMREELRQMWLSTAVSREQLTADLAAWCHRAEGSGITALRDFSLKLRAAQVA
jgi:stearoyl-CoA desaturase (delta-9 desaturase)